MAEQKPLDLGSTYRWLPEGGQIRKDGVVWSLTAATVTIQFRRPDGTRFERTCVIDNASEGRVHYDGTTTDLDQAGIWSAALRVQQGSLDVTLPSISFRVIDSP